MIKYKASTWKSAIDAVEVVKETAQFVVIERTDAFGKSTHREAKVSDYSRYFDSWGEAHQYHTDRVTNSIAATKRKLEQLSDELSAITKMLPPSVSAEKTA